MGIAGLAESFNAPSFKNWVLIPTLVLTIIFYIIGFSLAYELTRGSDRITTTVYDDSCKDKKDKTNCPSHEENVSPGAAYAIFAICAPIVAFMLCLFVYKIVIFIRNPKVAAGYFLLQGLRN
jgi:ammonia channel protein AmtB